MIAYFKVVLAVAGVLVVHATSEAADPAQSLIVAHRGLMRHAPENTLANFRACLELRIGFEFDVERTKDGHLVCIHDSTVDRTTNGTGTVSDLTLAQIRELDAGSWFDPKFAGEKVPTVDEVLGLVTEYRQHDVLIAVDLKAENVGQDVVRLAEKHKVVDRLLFIGRTIKEPNLRKQIKNDSGKANTAAVANDYLEFPKAIAARSANWVYVRYLPTKEDIEAVHRAKKRTFIAGSTISGNLPKNWEHAARVGIDAILTDYPLLLRTTLRDLEPKSDQAAAPVPVEARLITKRSKYVLPKDQHGEAFRKRILQETDLDKLPSSQAVDLVLELRNVSKHDLMIWPGGFITNPELEVDGPGVISPESLTTGSGGGSGTNVQPTIASGKTHQIPIKSLNPGYDTPSNYWCEPGEYTIRAVYEAYTGLPPLGSPDDEKPAEKRHRFFVTTPPIKVQVVLEGDERD
jgi:glycerophosphoryl diester phosphodiesterase